MFRLNFEDYDAFAFDFDGTLADTVATHTQARLKAFKIMAAETSDERFLTISPELQEEAHRHGSNPNSIIGWVLQQVGVVQEIDDDLVARTVEHKREQYHRLCATGLEAIDGSVEFLQMLNVQQQGSTYITTTAYRSEVTPFIDRYSLSGDLPVNHLVTFEDVGREFLKPHPRAYRLTIERAGLTETPRRVLAIEDTPGGVASAKAAGAKVVAVCTTHEAEAFAVPEAYLRPDFVFGNFSELAGKE
jgi:beta-phosphoglucomutase-like phosphatase (HAD superfamily)